MRKVEALAVAEAEHSTDEDIGSLERVLDRAEQVEPSPSVAAVISGDDLDEDWFGMKDGGAE